MRFFKKLLSCLIVSFLVCINASAYAIEDNKVELNIIDTKNLYLKGEIDKRILKRFVPVKFSIDNNTDVPVKLPGIVYYTFKGQKYPVANNYYLYDKSKRSMVFRAVVWGVIGGGLLSIFTIPGSIAHTSIKNSDLKDNVSRVNYRPAHVFPKETLDSYLFIPKKHKKATGIIMANIKSDNGKTLDLKAALLQQEQKK